MLTKEERLTIQQAPPNQVIPLPIAADFLKISTNWASELKCEGKLTAAPAPANAFDRRLVYVTIGSVLHYRQQQKQAARAHKQTMKSYALAAARMLADRPSVTLSAAQQQAQQKAQKLLAKQAKKAAKKQAKKAKQQAAQSGQQGASR